MRVLSSFVVLVLLSTAGVVAAGESSAADDCTVTAAIGIPGDTVAGLANAGAIEVHTSCTSTPTLLTLPSPHAGDRFGTSIVATGIDGSDTYRDLVVGVPGYDNGSLGDAGAVALFRGTTTGPTFDSLLVPGSGGVPGTAQSGARFGAAVNVFNPPFGTDVSMYVGEPGKDVDGAVDAGGYVDLALTSGAITADSKEVTLDSPGVPGTAARGDLLGSSVDVGYGAVGAPGRTVAGHAGAGALLAQNQLFTQDSPCVAGAPESGDHFGAVLSGPWIGVPDEDLGSVRDAGMVEKWLPSGQGATCLAFNQDVPGVSGSAEAGDRFGAALSGINVASDQPEELRSGFLVGVPGEDTGTHPNSGFVNVFAVNGSDDEEQQPTTYTPAGSTAGPNATGAAYGSAFGDYPVGGTQADIAGPGGSGVVYRVSYTPGQPLQHVGTRRPAFPVPANTWGAELARPG